MLTSPYSKIFGLSLTWWAFGYYGLLAVVLIAARRVGTVVSALMVPLCSLGGAVAAGWLIGVMKTQIGEFCPWCLAVHAVNITFFLIAVGRAQNLLEFEQQHRKAAGLPALGRRPVLAAWGFGVLAAVGMILLMVNFCENPELEITAVEGVDDPLEVVSLAATAGPDGPIPTAKGDPETEDRLVIFTCFTCSHCRKVNRILNDLAAHGSGRYRVELRIAPLSAECNPTWRGPQKGGRGEHDDACPIARVALAVALVEEGEFPGFADWLYEHQHGLTAQKALAEARRRVDATRLREAFESEAVRQRLAEDVALAERVHVAAVPQMFLGHGQVSGVIMQRNLADLLQAEFGATEQQRPQDATGR